MKIVVVGTGGVGGFFGGCLARGGADVTFLARGENLRTLREDGLQVFSALVGDFRLPAVQATDDPERLGTADLVLLCNKAYDLERCARLVLPLVGPDTVVIPLLNGADMAERAGAIIGMEHMMGGLVRVSARLERPGVVRHISWGTLMFGELEGGISPRGQAVLEGMRRAKTPAELLPDIRRELWSKLMQNATAAVLTVTRRPLGEVRSDPDTWALTLACLRETEAVIRGMGIPLEEEALAQVVHRGETAPPELKPSMLLDLENGRPLELESVTGAVVRAAARLGMDAPINRFIYAALKLHADGKG